MGVVSAADEMWNWLKESGLLRDLEDEVAVEDVKGRVFQQVRGVLYFEMCCPTYVVFEIGRQSHACQQHAKSRCTSLVVFIASRECFLHAAASVHLLVLTFFLILEPGRHWSC
jgi:hypothetical protein